MYDRIDLLCQRANLAAAAQIADNHTQGARDVRENRRTFFRSCMQGQVVSAGIQNTGGGLARAIGQSSYRHLAYGTPHFEDDRQRNRMPFNGAEDPALSLPHFGADVLHRFQRINCKAVPSCLR